ncbi:hypothetical protein PVAP13_6KG037635 [Panicum virgatum]|uniref:Uncharacterized protein n=1 Tax=Panicum virgatum TaxID=38727 RepID=A0A8T0R6Y0_PANVG|nr:hypothetical protein PVAP13_6KG037635 [Panicum virgatum]
MLVVRTAKEELNAMTARAPPLYPQAVCHGPAPPLLAAQQVDAGREAHGAASHATLRAGRQCRMTYPSTEMRGRGDAVLPAMLLQIRSLTPYTKQPTHRSPTLAHQKRNRTLFAKFDARRRHGKVQLREPSRRPHRPEQGRRASPGSCT